MIEKLRRVAIERQGDGGEDTKAKQIECRRKGDPMG